MIRTYAMQAAVLCALCLSMAAPVWSEAKKAEPQADRVAVVNGVAIDRQEYEGEIFALQKALLGRGRPLTCSQVTALQTEVLESMVRRELLVQESRKAGIKPDAAAISREIAALKQQFTTEADYLSELGRRGLTEEGLRSQLERNSVLQQYVDRQFVAKVTVADSDMVSYYESNIGLFKQPLQMRVSHILIQSDPKWDDPRKLEARKKAEQVMKSLKKGQDFAAVAREQSDGPTRTNGGDLGYIRTGQLEGPLESAVLKLKAGETSDIVETPYGYHLFKVFDRKPGTVVAYDTAKEQIRLLLTREQAKRDAEQYARSLREKAAVEIMVREDVSTEKRQ